jgi:hypothetical protein
VAAVDSVVVVAAAVVAAEAEAAAGAAGRIHTQALRPAAARRARA